MRRGKCRWVPVREIHSGRAGVLDARPAELLAEGVFNIDVSSLTIFRVKFHIDINGI